MSIIQLNLDTKSPENLKENTLRIQERLNSDVFLPGNWRAMEITFAGAVTAMPVPHGLKFLPLDVILTRKSTSATVDFVYNKFTDQNLYITVSAAVTIRILVGRFQ